MSVTVIATGFPCMTETRAPAENKPPVGSASTMNNAGRNVDKSASKDQSVLEAMRTLQTLCLFLTANK